MVNDEMKSQVDSFWLRGTWRFSEGGTDGNMLKWQTRWRKSLHKTSGRLQAREAKTKVKKRVCLIITNLCDKLLLKAIQAKFMWCLTKCTWLVKILPLVAHASRKVACPLLKWEKKMESIDTARLFEISLGPFKVILIITICDALIDLRAFYERAAIDG